MPLGTPLFNTLQFPESISDCLRFSFHVFNTPQQVQRLARAIGDTFRRVLGLEQLAAQQ